MTFKSLLKLNHRVTLTDNHKINTISLIHLMSTTLLEELDSVHFLNLLEEHWADLDDVQDNWYQHWNKRWPSGQCESASQTMIQLVLNQTKSLWLLNEDNQHWIKRRVCDCWTRTIRSETTESLELNHEPPHHAPESAQSTEVNQDSTHHTPETAESAELNHEPSQHTLCPHEIHFCRS